MYKDNDLLDKTQTIINEMTANVADYPVPVPALPAIQTAKNDFETAKADKGSPAKTAFKNAKRKVVIDLLNSEALYVQATHGNDEAKALRSGYDVRNPSSPIGDLPLPENFRVRAGENPGEIEASMNSYRQKANSYVFRYSQVEGSHPETWQSMPSSNARVLIAGLESGKRVSVQGAGVGASKHLVWSDVITRFVV